MIATLLAAMLIPPPPDWQPPHFAGPGLLCANQYGLNLVAGESAAMDRPATKGWRGWRDGVLDFMVGNRGLGSLRGKAFG